MLAIGALTASAQTDVTSTYLSNADFGQTDAIEKDICGYGKDMTTNGTTLYGYLDVDGWTQNILSGDNSNATYPNSGMIGAVMAYGANTAMRGGGATPPADGPDSSTNGKCLAILGVWGCGGYYYQTVTFPAGEYTLTVPVYNASGTATVDPYIGFFPDAGTAYKSKASFTVGSWETLTIEFKLAEETPGRIAVGYKSNGSGSGANPHLFIDRVNITYKAAVIKDELEAAIQQAESVKNITDNAALAVYIVYAIDVCDTSNSQDEINATVATLKEKMEEALTAYINETGDASALIYNNSFELCDPVTENYATSGSANSVNYESTGWSLTQSAAWCASAAVTYGMVDEGQVNGVNPPEADNNGNGDRTLGISVGWNSTIAYQSAEAITLPAGAYTLTIHAYNNNPDSNTFTSKNGFITAGGTNYLSNKTSFTYGEWTTDVITFTLEESTAGYIQIGGTAGNATSGNHAKVFFDNIELKYESLEAGAKTAWEEALAAANAAIADDYYKDVKGSEYYNIVAEVEKEEPTTVAGYQEATTALQEALEAYTTAAPYYTAYANENEKALALGMTDTGYLVEQTDAWNNILVKTQNIKVSEYDYVCEQYQSSVELGTWNASEGTGTMSGQHWDGTDTSTYLEQSSANWSASAWTISYDQDITLPAGDYVFKVAGRQAGGDGVVMSLIVTNGEEEIGKVADFPRGDTGRGITTNGVTSYYFDAEDEDTPHYANNDNGRGWEWRYVRFTLAEQATVNVAVTAVATQSHQWVSFCNASVLTDNEANISMMEYFVALNDAMAAAEDPQYSNVWGEESQALQDAIAADPGTTAESIAEATTSLKQATETFTQAKESYNNLVDAINRGDEIAGNDLSGEDPFQRPYGYAGQLASDLDMARTTPQTAEAAQAYADKLNDDIVATQNVTLNEPAKGQQFFIVNVTEEFRYKDKALTFKSSASADLEANTTSMGWTEDPASAFPQAVTFVKADQTESEEPIANAYYLCYTRSDGNTIYLSTGLRSGFGDNTQQIRPTTDIEKALVFQVVATNDKNVWKLYNTENGNYVGSNGDQGFYTNGGTNSDVCITEATTAAIVVVIREDAKYATAIMPFSTTLPEGVKAYTCAATIDNVLEMVEVEEISANVPYIIYGNEPDLEYIQYQDPETLEPDTDQPGYYLWNPTGYGARFTDEAITDGLLTGVYANTYAPAGSYVLQQQTIGEETKVAFYRVENDEEILVPAYKAYMNAEAGDIKAFFFGGDDTTGINSISNVADLLNNNHGIYNASGALMPSLQKGMNIIRTADGNAVKVFVK